MIKIQDGFVENEYLRNCKDTVFTMMVREEMMTSPKLEKFKNIYYVHGLLSYPPKWEKTTDLFSLISETHLKLLRMEKIYFVFDSSTEGFSPVNDFPFFDVLYYNCEKYNVKPERMIYVSSNLKDEENIVKYCQERNKEPINVFSFVSFEKVVRAPLSLQNEKEFCRQDFQDKYFSSLSRVNRYYRTLATFMLCHDPVSEKALISHDKFPKDISKEHWKRQYGLHDYTTKEITRWFKTLPRVVDKKNFNVNWALDNDYYYIHRKTLFQIVNETLVENYGDTSLFYSEKTFRPIVCFQPFVIYGQRNINKHLKNIGYKTYDEWFDLSFDDEPDNVLRYKKLLASVKDTCNYLDSLTREQQIEWRFKNEELLQHNFLVMSESLYSKQKLKNFLEKLYGIN